MAFKFSKTHGCTLILLLAQGIAAAQSLTGVTPAVVGSGNYSFFTINGAGLGSYDSFAIQKNGGNALPLEIITQTSTAVDCGINLAPEPVGLYAVMATGPSLPTLQLGNAFELTRSSYLNITRPTLTNSEFPFTAGFDYINTQFILDQSDIGAAGKITMIRLYFAPGAPQPTGTLTVRMKHTALSTFPNNQLDATGWSNAYSGSFPAIVGDSMAIYLTQFFLYDGSQNLMVSILNDATTLGFSTSVQMFDTGSDRLIGARSNLNAPTTANWTGTVPASRSLRTQIPKVSIEFASDSTMANFSAATTVTQNDSLPFFNGSSDLGGASPMTYAWDFNGDGVTDSTQATPSYTWSTPGVYTVELITTKGYAQDAETKLNYVTVTPASGVDWTLIEME